MTRVEEEQRTRQSLARFGYLREENRVLRNQIKNRILLTDPERRRLTIQAVFPPPSAAAGVGLGLSGR